MPHLASPGATLAGPDDLAIPDSLRRNIRFIRGDGADAWLNHSVSLAVDLAASWSVDPVAVLEGGAMSVVVLCRDVTGILSVLKIPGNRAMGLAESSAPAIWDNGALPRLIATDAETGSFLMEHVAAATALIAWLQDSAAPMMVHGDFQAKNVLHGVGGPVAIDPLPASRDPVSDLGLWIGGGSAGPRARALWIFMGCAEDPLRLLAWTWAMTVLEYRPGNPGSENAAEFIAGHRDVALPA